MKWWIIFGVLYIGILLGNTGLAQVVYEPLHRDVYGYLDRLAQKGIIEYDNLIKPLPRKYLAQKLLAASRKIDELTALERDELRFYQKDFFLELMQSNKKPLERYIQFWGWDPGKRKRFFTYQDSFFTVNLSPIYGERIGGNKKGDREKHRWNGAYLYGYFAKRIGYSFDFRDNFERGDRLNVDKVFTPVTGNQLEWPVDSSSIEYSETHASAAVDWKWGSAAIGKEFMEWGYARNGKVVLSQKAPSFPYFRLDLRLTDWFSFNYFHGSLLSNVVDSTRLYATLDPARRRKIFIKKYLVSHTVIIKPIKGLSAAFGESIVYSDGLKFAYWNPILFFRLTDHYLSNMENLVGSNAQLFMAISSRNHLPRTHLYTEWFIDDLSIPNFFNKEKRINYLGWTNGLSVADFLIDNLTIRSEYTRVNPFAYRHFIPSLTYQNAGYNLGHWMEHNADLIYGALNYRFRRGVQATLWGQRIRKGGEGNIYQQYRYPHPSFLFGLRKNFVYLGIDFKYQMIHELFFNLKFAYNQSSEELKNGSKLKKNSSEFSAAFYYGL